MKRFDLKTTIAFAAFFGLSALARAEIGQQVQSQVKLLQTAQLDASGTFIYSYSGCEGHYGRVSIAPDSDEGLGLAAYLNAIRIRVYDISYGKDGCKSKKTIEGSAKLKDLIRNAPDLRGATFQRDVPVKLPNVGLPGWTPTAEPLCGADPDPKARMQLLRIADEPVQGETLDPASKQVADP